MRLNKMYWLLLWWVWVGLQAAYANMASPTRFDEPAWSALEVVPSQQLQVLHESIVAHVAPDLRRARFVVQYQIDNQHAEALLPLRFYYYQGGQGTADFEVWVDEKKVAFTPASDSAFDATPDITTASDVLPAATVDMALQTQDFSVVLPQGVHVVKVAYWAYAGMHGGGDFKQAEFAYDLRPSLQWQSFGMVDIQVLLPQADLALNAEWAPTTKTPTLWAWQVQPSAEISEFVFRLDYPVMWWQRVLVAIAPWLWVVCLLLPLPFLCRHLRRLQRAGRKRAWVVTLWTAVVALPLLVLAMYAVLVPLLLQWGLGAVLSPSYGDAWVYMGMALLVLGYPVAILVYTLVLLAFGRIAPPRATQPPVV